MSKDIMITNIEEGRKAINLALNHLNTNIISKIYGLEQKSLSLDQYNGTFQQYARWLVCLNNFIKSGELYDLQNFLEKPKKLRHYRKPPTVEGTSKKIKYSIEMPPEKITALKNSLITEQERIRDLITLVLEARKRVNERKAIRLNILISIGAALMALVSLLFSLNVFP
ncbi:hypothetical protein NEF87_000149 [Candidatus Lokiarchaeum ossiferum]|uniref:Uncharacterized protein n=1 Tax=Candidatus Lokiarchaeum ossiferum TaxID=2951803 RepID=A0ABY6HMR1_9ARCH|nr:hypothetical protein NEF87_000149 [Candidatus Lokiarchaeum sp. B-35]